MKSWNRVLLAGLGCLAPVTGMAAERPNIVVFISDDMGRAECSVYGSKEGKTPTMQMLAPGGSGECRPCGGVCNVDDGDDECRE